MNTSNFKVLGFNNQILGEVSPTDKNLLNKYHSQILGSSPEPLKNEFFEVLTRSGEKTGKIKLRDIVHQEGVWHGAFHLHIYTVTDDEPYFIMQKRKHNKDTNPDKLATVAAGHYGIGEVLEDGVREVKEEIGLKVSFQDLTYFGKRIKYSPKLDGRLDCEYQDVTFLRNDQPLESYILQEAELAGIVKVKLFDFIDMMKMKTHEIKNVEALLFNDRGGIEKHSLTINRDDIQPASFDSYYLKTALFIEMLLKRPKIQIENPFMKDVTNFI